MFNEGVNKQLAAAQIGKKWRLERVSDEEINARLSNASKSQFNIDAIIKLLADADPTPNKEFFPWLLTQYINEKVRLPEDGPVLHQDLTFYSTIKKNGVLKRLQSVIKEKMDVIKNPMDITTIDRTALQKMVDLVQELTDGNTDSNRKKTTVVKQEGAESIYSDDEWEVVKVLSGAAACYYARGTRWCTSSERTANDYLEDGPLYIVYKEGKPFGQVHFASKQFMDVKDDPIKNIQDEIGQVLLTHIPDLDDDDKALIYKSCDRSGDLYQNYTRILETQMYKMIEDAGLRDEISVNTDWEYHDHGEESYLPISANIYFKFPLEDFIKSPEEIERDYALLRTIKQNLDISVSDYPRINTYGNDVTIDFDINEEGMAKDDEERMTKFLDYLTSDLNEDEKYFKHKHEIYQVLVQNDVLKKKVEEDEDGAIGLPELSHFEFDQDEFNSHGALSFESYRVDICSIEEANLSDSVTGHYRNNYESLKGNFKPIEDIFESLIRKRAMAMIKHHKAQGWLPYPGMEKPKLPEGYESLRAAPKVKVKMWINKDKVQMNVSIEAHIHKHSSKAVEATFKKVKQLDEKFTTTLPQAREIFLKKVASTIEI